MDAASVDYVELADWRRRMAQLYAEVRNLQRYYDPSAAHAQWRAMREQLYREHPQSPVPPDERADFAARHFPYDPALRFEVTVVADALPDGAGGVAGASAGDVASASAGDVASPTVPTSGGGAMGVRRIGLLDVPFPVGERRLGLYWLEGYAGGLFLSFRDATNGGETYGGGRYLLDGAKSADLGGDIARGTLVLDFNFAYQPSCAFDPRWDCPLVPPENRLDIPIEGGEQL